MEVRRGRLRVYLGAAPGVGKTFAMLGEGRRRAERGTDVVVGFVETHGRPRTMAELEGLDVVPRRQIDYRGTSFEEMDTDAIVARSPDVVLVDELAHTNVPGSPRPKRIDDVAVLLDSGIDVITTVNVQHLESLNDVVEEITGIKQQETVPDSVVRGADQVELVDMDPEALRRRMAHGNIYAPQKVDAALGNYFRVGNLTALRELALMWVADRVDEALQKYLDDHQITGTWETRERVVVAVTGAPSGEQLIRRAARMAARMKGDLLGVHIRPDDGLAPASPELLDVHRQLLEDLGGTYHEVVGSEVAEALCEFADAERATQVVVGASSRSRWKELTQGSVINNVARRAHSFDLHVIGTAGEAHGRSLPSPPARQAALSGRRRVAGWALTVLGIPLLTFALAHWRDDLLLSGDLMAYLMLVVLISAVGGAAPGLTAAIVSSLALNWYFTEPIHTWTVDEAENAAALLGFVVVSAVISLFVTASAHRQLVGLRASAEAEALARVAAGLVGSDDPMPSMLDRLRTTFGLERATVESRDPATGDWTVEWAAARDPDDGSESAVTTSARTAIDLDDSARLVLVGRRLAAEDQRVLHAFVAQLASALEQTRLRSEAAAASLATESDALRTALLRAVSHDLRTPLSSIKASVSGLLQGDVDWSPEATEQLLRTIDEEADRLDSLVGNLLDMSRLETGALQIAASPVGWDEVVASALSSLSEPHDAVDVDVPESLPPIVADPVLLERAVANLVSNALRHTPPGIPVRVEAGAVGGRVDLRIIDRGPGVPPEEREQIFSAFQRLGDTAPEGVGLGSAVARGFVEALGGQIEADETPGGGLTMVIRMEAA